MFIQSTLFVLLSYILKIGFHGLFIRKIHLIEFLVRCDDKDAKSKEAFSAYFTFLLEKMRMSMSKPVFKISFRQFRH